jgi:hypothetical protein
MNKKALSTYLFCLVQIFSSIHIEAEIVTMEETTSYSPYRETVIFSSMSNFETVVVSATDNSFYVKKRASSASEGTYFEAKKRKTFTPDEVSAVEKIVGFELPNNKFFAMNRVNPYWIRTVLDHFDKKGFRLVAVLKIKAPASEDSDGYRYVLQDN